MSEGFDSALLTRYIERMRNMVAGEDNKCYSKAIERGEQTFTLVAHDKTSPKTICFWIMENIETASEEKLLIALMDAFNHRAHPKRRMPD